ncbi:MAG: hypothetical protein MAG581_02077 [Deltaproteobacteria bacterium]|jgi:DNA-binding Lrp family transcriptional regulator|nr:hypothetical protein [Deltaproteobacteria bacterium]
MVTALVLLNVDRNLIKDVSQNLVDMQEVSEVYSVAGRYDLVAIIRVKSNEQIADTITGKLAELEGITATETLIAFNTFSRHDLELMFSIGE